MDLVRKFHSKTFHKFLVALGILIIILIIFKAGEFVGYEKAGFSYRWADNYHRNFGSPRGSFFGNFFDRDYIGAHGITGSIIKIDGNTLIIKGKDDVEKTITITDKSIIKNKQEVIHVADLKIDDQVVIIGSPNEQGAVDARFIRIFR